MDINKICPNCMREYEGNFCPRCGFGRNSGQDNTHALKPYTILSGKYLVGNVIGEGGFGITYIGFDLNLEVRIAIKEYYPNGFVTRESDVTSMVTGYTTNDPAQYQKWKDSFVKEARNLAKFSNLPGIVHVRDFFQENNTAYIIMEYVEGETLKTYLKNRSDTMPVEEVLELMEPVIKSLSKVHDGGIIHRDISPDNIMIQEGGDVKLIDFGAAREFESGNERSMSVLLKPGYAPEEQYRTKGEQGPWTDVYALCATIYRCITGVKPVESMERMRADELKKPSELGITIQADTEKALMTGMAVYADNRIRDMRALHAALYKGARVEIPGTREGTSSIAQNTIKAEPGTKAAVSETGGTGKLFSDKRIMIAIASTAILLIVLLVVIAVTLSGRKRDNISESGQSVAETAASAPAVAAEESASAQAEAAKAIEGSEEKEDAGKQDADGEEVPDIQEKKDEGKKESKDRDTGMEDPLTDKERYMEQYEKLAGDYWNDPDHAGWDLIGLEIVNFNQDKSDVPEVLTLWDFGDGQKIAQTIFGLDSSKDGKRITSSTVYDYNLEIYEGSDRNTIAYTVNEEDSMYLVDSNEGKAFSVVLNDDPEYDCEIRGEFVGRVPEVFERASQTPSNWTPDGTTYYRVYDYERDEVFDALTAGMSYKDHEYASCNINYSESGTEKDRLWQEAWDEAWKLYEEYWLD